MTLLSRLRRSDDAPTTTETIDDAVTRDDTTTAIEPAPAATLVDASTSDEDLQRALDEATSAARAVVEQGTEDRARMDAVTARMDAVEGEIQRRAQIVADREALAQRIQRAQPASTVGFAGGRDRFDAGTRDPDDQAQTTEERIQRALRPVHYHEGANWFYDVVHRQHDPFAAQRIADYGTARLRAVQRAGLGIGAALDMDHRVTRAVTGTGEGAVAGNVAATAAGLVQPEYFNDLISELRREVSQIAPLVTSRNVNSNSFYVQQVTAGVSVAFRAELAVKARSNMTVGSLGANVYSMSGVTIVSDELAEDSSPDAVQMIARDYAAQQMLGVDNTILNGTGSSQPLGIIAAATAASQTTAYAGAGTVGANLYAQLRSVGTLLYTGGYYGRPDTIIMRPEHAGFLLDALGNSTASLPLLTANTTTGDLSFMGVKIVTTTLLPVTAGSPDTAPIIVGNLKTVVLGIRHGVRFATSEHFAFDQDAITLRSDQRFGVQPSRYLPALRVITGVPTE